MKAELIRAPSAGEDTASAPAYVRQDSGTKLLNMLPGRMGKVVQRGPVTQRTAATIAAGLGGGAGAFTPATFGSKVLLDVSGGFATADASSGTVSATFGSSGGLVGGQGKSPSMRLGDFAYGLTSNAVFRWDGTSVSAGLVKITQGPQGSPTACAVGLSRLFVLGGSIPGTASPTFNDRIYWTDPAWSGVDTLASWQDDVTGLVNQIVLPDAADNIVALVPLTRSLLIMRQNSIQALTGTSPANFSIRTVAHVGAWDARAITTVDDSVYFLSDQGFMRFDGADVVSIGEAVRPDLARGLNYIPLHVNRLGDRFLSIVTQDKWLLYHTITGAWCEMSSVAVFGGSGMPTYVGRSDSGVTFGFNGSWFARMEFLTNPELGAVASPGSAGWDLSTTVISNQVDSRVVALSSPFNAAQLHRVYADIVLQSTNPAVTATVTATDANGTTLGSTTIAATATAKRQRAILDIFTEAEQVQVSVVNSGNTTTAIAAFELQDINVEYQPAQSRTG
jgi:hypothetical protein